MKDESPLIQFLGAFEAAWRELEAAWPRDREQAYINFRDAMLTALRHLGEARTNGR